MNGLDPLGLLWILALWALVGLGLWMQRARSPLHMATVALVVTGLIGSFFPFASSFIEPSSWRNLDVLSPSIVRASQLQYVAYACGLVLALVAANGRARRTQPSVETRDTTSRDFAASALLVGAGLAMYAVYAERVGMSALTDREDYAAKYLASQGLGPLQLGLPMAMAGCLWAEASELTRARKLPFRAVALAIVIWSIAFISVRTNAVVVALGYASVLAHRSRFELRRIRPALVAAGLVGYVFLESFALLRGVYRGDLEAAIARVAAQGEVVLGTAIGGSELSHPFITTGEVLRSREAGELGGESLWNGVAACLPRGLYPDRPPFLSEQFVRSNYADLASRGGGAAFSLVAEAWLNFGSFLGPFAFGLAAGWLLVACERRRETHPAGLVARVLPYFVFYVAMQHRNEFGSLFKQVFMLCLVIVPVWIVAEALSRSPRRARELQPLQGRS